MAGSTIVDLSISPEVHEPWLRRAISRRVPKDLLDDVLQDTFSRVAKRDDLKVVRSPRALLLRIALGVSRDQWRRKAVRDAAQPHLVSISPAHTEADQEEVVFLKQLVTSLPADCREIFVLQRLYGLTYDQIARQTGLSLKAVEGRMSKALAICARKLAD